MRRLVLVAMAGMFAVAPLAGAGQAVCGKVAVEARVEAGLGELTLADLLARDTCAEFQQAARRVHLGAAPLAGGVRVIDGGEIRRQILRAIGELAGIDRRDQVAAMEVPERIVVQRAGATKSCAEIARFVASVPSSERVDVSGRGRDDLDCAGAHAIPHDADLEITKTTWNAAMKRWEFSMRCVEREECVPFLVWTREQRTIARGIAGPKVGGAPSVNSTAESSALSLPETNGGERLVKAGQTATLSWEQRGIRVVMPVTCLDGGGLGQFVRVRFKNAPRILRAEVLGDGTLRASL